MIIARHRHRLLIIFLLSAVLPTTPLTHHRHLLHQPFFFQTGLPPSPSPTASSKPPPSPQLHQQPKYPFSTTPPTAPQNPFFPSVASPPPQPPQTSLPTFPANISSLLLPNPPSSSSSHSHVLLISLSASLLAAALILSLTTLFVFLRRRNYRRTSSPLDKTDSVRLFPPDTAPSDASLKPSVMSSSTLPSPPPHYVSTNRSSEFLYLGTLVNSQPGVSKENTVLPRNNAGKKICFSASPGSPELRPLPPLPRLSNFPTGEQFFRSGEVSVGHEEVKTKDAEEEDNEEFFSPRGSSGRRDISPPLAARIESSSRRDIFGENFGSRSFNSRTASYPYSHTCSPTSSIPNSSPPSRKSNSPDSVIAANYAARPRASFSASSSSSTVSSSFTGQNKQSKTVPVTVKIPPPPPPLPPARFWEIPAVPNMSRESISGPPPLVAPSRPVVVEVGVNGSEELVKSEESGKPKLKPLHWDKVRASSDRAMVWDQIKASSFQ